MLGWHSVYDLVLEKGWAAEQHVSPVLAAWEFDFEIAVDLIARLNIAQAW